MAFESYINAYSSVSYGGRRGGFKIKAASKGTSRHSATKMAICAGEEGVSVGSVEISELLGGSGVVREAR